VRRGRGLMPGGAGQLSSGGGQGRGAGAVTAEPLWVAERPRRRDSGRGRAVERVSPVARMSGRRPVVALSASSGRRGMSVQPVDRTSSIQVSGVQCIQVSGRTGSGVRGAAAALSARWTPEWLGGAGRPGRAQRVDMPPWSGGGVGACLHRSGREGDGAALAVPGWHEG
jgi:hypothetical protein